MRATCKKIYFLFIFSLILLSGCSILQSRDKPVLEQPNKTQETKSFTALKIYIEQDGMYQLGLSDLSDYGLENYSIDPANLRLIHQGYEQPLWIDGEGEELMLRFYGESSKSRFSRENVYWLVTEQWEMANEVDTNNLLNLEAQEPNQVSKPGTYAEIIRLEENQIYLPQSDSEDHWYWASLPAPNSQSVEATLTSVELGQAVIQLTVWASTDAESDPDHHLRVRINDVVLIDETWDGKGTRTLNGKFSSEVLKNGINQIIVESPGDTDVLADVVYIDKLEISYPRIPMATDDRLFFWSTGSHIRLQGFSGKIDNYDITHPDRVERVLRDYDPRSTLVGLENHRYLAVGRRGYLKPTQIVIPQLEPNLKSEVLMADYIAIGPNDLLKSLEPVFELRKLQGLRVLAVDINAVYDQFNHGVPDPGAIHQFMQYAYDHWDPQPKYLVLVGDSTYDPLGYISTDEANITPAMFVDTEFGGETVGDVDFVQLNDEPWPDLAIGHIPAQRPDQVEILVDKILKYEYSIDHRTNPMNVLAIADGQSPAFGVDAQTFLDLFPSRDFNKDLLSPTAGDLEANKTIRSSMENNNSIIAYFGHGSLTMWGKDRLFTDKDVEELSNDQLPIILNFTCLTGLFTHPLVESLTESLLWQPNGGAVAVFAPSSLTLPSDQSFLSNSIGRIIVNNPAATLGEIHLQARREVPTDTSGTLDVMQTFMLFGDPALRISGAAP